MRTKNKKWTVSILALVPMLALAAFLAAGLLTANEAQALGKGKCGFIVNAVGAGGGNILTVLGGDADEDYNAAEDSLLSGIGTPCYVSGDSIDITVENSTDMGSSDEPLKVTVFVTGGSQFRKVAVANGKTGVSQNDFDLRKMTDDRGKTALGVDPDNLSITVTRSMAKGGAVVLTAYDEFTNFPVANNDTELPAGADTTMYVVFLGDPAPGQGNLNGGNNNDVDFDDLVYENVHDDQGRVITGQAIGQFDVNGDGDYGDLHCHPVGSGVRD